MDLIVIIVTAGRREILARSLALLARQTRRPDLVIVSAPDESHVGKMPRLPFPLVTVFGASGCTAQRNRALDCDAVAAAGTIVFLDDDFLPARDYLGQAEAALAARPDWAVLTGTVLADGVTGPGLGFDEALAILDAAPSSRGRGAERIASAGAYGCNMVYRGTDIGARRFDERLPLYGWQEDTDFSRRVAAGRPIMRLQALAGVHMGVKSGRVSGLRFGYSQVANPLYLMRKRTAPPLWALRLMARNIAANAVGSLRPERHVDRRGRLRGNLLAMGHLLGGRVDPEHITRL